MRKNTAGKRVTKVLDTCQQRGRMKVPRVVIINDQSGPQTYATDDPKLEIYSTDLRPDGLTWSEVYRFGPVIDRVWPITLDRIIGNADEIGHYGDMAHILESLDRPKPKAATRNAKKRRGHSAT